MKPFPMIRSKIKLVLILATGFILSSCGMIQTASNLADPSALVDTRQLIIIVTNSWDDVSSELRYFERPNLGDDWKIVEPKTAIVLGRTGLAWGNGLHGSDLGEGPIKHEGDGKSPAGVFNISAVFGYAAVDSTPGFKMPYIQLNESTQCVDDINSIYYNLVVDSAKVKKADWNSCEHMRRKDVLYKWGALIDNNMMPRKTAGGSCIFLHIWGGPDKPTSGCTSFDEPHLLSMLQWLDKSKNPILLQVPKQV